MWVIYLKLEVEELELLCRYLSPSERLVDGEYLLLAKMLLDAYHRQCSELCYEPDVIDYIMDLLALYRSKCLEKLISREKGAEVKPRNLLEFLGSFNGIMSLNSALELIMSPELMNKAREFLPILKLLLLVGYYVREYYLRRRYNGALQRIAQRIDKLSERLREELESLIRRKGSEGLFLFLETRFKDPEVLHYINRGFIITERFVYELALKLREARLEIYGHA